MLKVGKEQPEVLSWFVPFLVGIGAAAERGGVPAGASLAVSSGARTEPPPCGHEQGLGVSRRQNQETWGTGLGRVDRTGRQWDYGSGFKVKSQMAPASGF